MACKVEVEITPDGVLHVLCSDPDVEGHSAENPARWGWHIDRAQIIHHMRDPAFRQLVDDNATDEQVEHINKAIADFTPKGA